MLLGITICLSMEQTLKYWSRRHSARSGTVSNSGDLVSDTKSAFPFLIVPLLG